MEGRRTAMRKRRSPKERRIYELGLNQESYECTSLDLGRKAGVSKIDVSSLFIGQKSCHLVLLTVRSTSLQLIPNRIY